MGHKVNPISLRIGICQDWQSRWFARKREFGKLLVEDARIRQAILGRYRLAAISKVEIERTGDEVRLTLHTARPGIVIGRKGAEVDRLREQIEQLCGQKVAINIKEIPTPEVDASFIATSLAEEIQKRARHKSAMKRASEAAMAAGALGVRIRIAGRLAGAEIARSEEVRVGRVPLHTLRAKINYAFTEAMTPYGNIGIKVWTYCGEEAEASEHGPHA